MSRGPCASESMHHSSLRIYPAYEHANLRRGRSAHRPPPATPQVVSRAVAPRALSSRTGSRNESVRILSDTDHQRRMLKGFYTWGFSPASTLSPPRN
jgi:hypothetical protein